MEGQVSTPNGSSCNGEVSLSVPELGLPGLWDPEPLFSLPGDPCKSTTFADPNAYLL